MFRLGVLWAGLSGCFAPTYPTELTCSNQLTCPPGQGCNELTKTCTPECIDGHCAMAVDIRAVRFEQLAPTPRPGVEVRLFDAVQTKADGSPGMLVGGGPTGITDENGLTHFDRLQPQTLLEVQVHYDNADPLFDHTYNELGTSRLGGNLEQRTSIEIPVVDFNWIAKVAVDCGLFASEADALYGTNGSNTPNPLFISRSSIVGEVFNLDHVPAHIKKSDIKVDIDGWSNFDGNPNDTDAHPATVCLLVEDEASGMYRGTTASETSSGKFVMFRVRNQVGTSGGLAQLQIQGYPTALASIRQADFGLMTTEKGKEAQALPAESFARDVYKVMTNLGCRACHSPGQIGFEMGMVRGGKAADFSGTPEEVFDVLTAGQTTDCGVEGGTPARVCRSNPEKSLFYTKPRLETGGTPSDHLGIAFPEGNPNLTLVLQWIKNGAKE